MTEYYCEKCGSRLKEIPQTLSDDPMLECPKCLYRVRVDHSNDFPE